MCLGYRRLCAGRRVRKPARLNLRTQRPLRHLEDVRLCDSDLGALLHVGKQIGQKGQGCVSRL